MRPQYIDKIKQHLITAFIFLKKRSFLCFVIAPLLLSAFYYSIIASYRYESSTILSLNMNQNNPISNSFSAAFTGEGSDAIIMVKSRLIMEYILSEAMLQKLQEEINLKDIYQKPSIDFISRLSRNANQAEFLDYYQSMSDIGYDDMSNSITINIEGFSPLDANMTLNNIVHFAQEKVDEISRELAENRMRFMTSELDRIKIKAIKSQEKLILFQKNNGLVSPTGSLDSKSQVLAQLQLDLANSEASLSSLESYLNPLSAEIIAKKQEVDALKKQIEREKKIFLMATGKKGESELSNIINSYQWLKLENDFSMKEYSSTLEAHEEAQMDSVRQQTYLVEVMKPTYPDAPSYPKVFYQLLLIFIVLSAIYGILKMVITIVLEHR